MAHKIEAFECPVCSSLIPEPDLQTHLHDEVSWVDGWQCEDCFEIYESENEAEECCAAD